MQIITQFFRLKNCHAVPAGRGSWFEGIRTTYCLYISANSLNPHTHQGLHHSWIGSGWINFPKASWENLQDAVPGEANPAASPRPPSASFHSWKSTGSTGAPQAFRQMPGCPLDSQQQALTGLSLVQGWRKIASQKKQLKKMWKIYTAQVSAQSAGGKSSRQPCREDSMVLLRRGWKECETLSPGGGEMHTTPFTFCPL